MTDETLIPASKLRLRRSVPEDAVSIGAIRVAAWRAAYGGILPEAYLARLDSTANLADLRAALGADVAPFTLWIAHLDGQPAAFSILGRPRYEAGAGVAELWALNVHPAHWRKGAGRALVEQACADARAQGFAALELWCLCANMAARALYDSSGFSPAGTVRVTDALTGHPLEEMAYRRSLGHRAPPMDERGSPVSG